MPKPEINMTDYDQMILIELLYPSINGDANIQNLLGTVLFTGRCDSAKINIIKNELGAFYWYCQAIKKGHVEAKWNAGTMLINGEAGLQVNIELGMRLIEDSALANYCSACLFLSDCYMDGKYGKKIDQEKSIFWQKKAWDYENIQEFDDKPIDIEKELNLKIDMPVITIDK